MRRVLALAVELVGGVIVGVMGAMIVAAIWPIAFGVGDWDWGELNAAARGIWLAYLIGAPVGVYLGGKRLRQEGSFGLALAGSGLSGGIAYVFAGGILEESNLYGFYALFMILPLLFAVLGYNLKLAWKGGGRE